MSDTVEEGAVKTKNRGRPPLNPDNDSVLHVRCTAAERETFVRLGGTPWLRELLDSFIAAEKRGTPAKREP